MDTMQTILNRRSTRKYTDDPIPQETVNAILQAGLLAPTSQNRKPCEFYVIKDKDTLSKLSKAKKLGAGMIAECDTAIAVFASSQKADTWIEDCSIAMSFMSLMATDLGIGNCWCQMHLRSSLSGKNAEECVREILQITDDSLRIVGVLALGIPEKKAQPHTEGDADWIRVHKI